MAKLSTEEQSELESLTPSDLDGCLWEDHVRVSKAPRGGYVLRKTATGRVLARFALIADALREAQKRNRKAWR